MEDIKKKYKTIMDDHFPAEMRISFGDQTLLYRKKTWKIAGASGQVVEKGLRYGENPGQEAALYELVNGNLVLADCKFIEAGMGLVSAVTEEQMVQAGKHPGKTNLTDVDNALNILKYLMGRPCCAIMKHNNPCGVALADSVAQAYHRANMADRMQPLEERRSSTDRSIGLQRKRLHETTWKWLAAPDFEEGAIDILKSAPTSASSPYPE